jgi:hypothetical protein
VWGGEERICGKARNNLCFRRVQNDEQAFEITTYETSFKYLLRLSAYVFAPFLTLRSDF